MQVRWAAQDKGADGQVAWVNGAKLVAMLAVLVDHTNGVLYTSQEVALASYFSVALFILLSGMASYMANANGRDISGGGISKPVKKYCLHTVWRLRYI